MNEGERTSWGRSLRRPCTTVESRRRRAEWRCSSTCALSWTCTLYRSSLQDTRHALAHSSHQAPVRSQVEHTQSCYRPASASHPCSLLATGTHTRTRTHTQVRSEDRRYLPGTRVWGRGPSIFLKFNAEICAFWYSAVSCSITTCRVSRLQYCELSLHVAKCKSTF